MNLYQYSLGYQPHYVVAMDYADAEQSILSAYAAPEKIECLGPYIALSISVRMCVIEDGVEEVSE